MDFSLEDEEDVYEVEKILDANYLEEVVLTPSTSTVHDNQQNLVRHHADKDHHTAHAHLSYTLYMFYTRFSLR